MLVIGTHTVGTRLPRWICDDENVSVVRAVANVASEERHVESEASTDVETVRVETWPLRERGRWTMDSSMARHHAIEDVECHVVGRRECGIRQSHADPGWPVPSRLVSVGVLRALSGPWRCVVRLSTGGLQSYRSFLADLRLTALHAGLSLWSVGAESR